MNRLVTVLVGLGLIVMVLAACSTPSAGNGDPLTKKGEQLFSISGCPSCHMLGKYDSGRVGTNLNGIGSRATEDYIRTSLMTPDAEIAKTCISGPCQPGLMPKFGEQMNKEQIDSLVAYLASQK